MWLVVRRPSQSVDLRLLNGASSTQIVELLRLATTFGASRPIGGRTALAQGVHALLSALLVFRGMLL